MVVAFGWILYFYTAIGKKASKNDQQFGQGLRSAITGKPVYAVITEPDSILNDSRKLENRSSFLRTLAWTAKIACSRLLISLVMNLQCI